MLRNQQYRFLKADDVGTVRDRPISESAISRLLKERSQFCRDVLNFREMYASRDRRKFWVASSPFPCLLVDEIIESLQTNTPSNSGMRRTSLNWGIERIFGMHYWTLEIVTAKRGKNIKLVNHKQTTSIKGTRSCRRAFIFQSTHFSSAKN